MHRKAVLIAVAGTALAAARLLLGPAGGQQAAPAPKPEAPTYVEDELCVVCHSDHRDELVKSTHGRLITQLAAREQARLCQDCHGPGSLHIENPVDVRTAHNAIAPRPERAAAVCLTCHAEQISLVKWRRSDHATADMRCWDCHLEKTHGVNREPVVEPVNDTPDIGGARPKRACLKCHPEEEAHFQLNSHHPVREGQMQCYDCHNPHASVLDLNPVETCRTCHKRQRGPYLFEHGAISGGMTDGCLDCHEPHGAANRRLLKLPGRPLCLQCHADRTTHFFGTNCVECHVAVHGSNTSPLLLDE